MTKRAWGLLCESVGAYQGRGINHEKQPFTESLELKAVVQNKMLVLEAKAVGDQGEVFHQEHSFIGLDHTGSLQISVASNNHPGIFVHVFDRIEETAECIKILFRFGNKSDRNQFREEISFSIFQNKSIGYNYAWGLPGGEFEPRSGAVMTLQETT